MGMYKRYEGEFLSRRGVTWRAEIWQEAEEQFPIVGELNFPAESPLTIEWAHTDKEAVICGSTASLTIISPGDRTYEDLYSVQPGRVRMDVYRNGNLYWSGTLDPEFYEEPYSSYKEYDVQLTFSDFGILDRFKYRLGGIQTLLDLVKHCIDTSGISYGDIRQDYITTSLDYKNAMSLADLSIRSENFYDEDGEASTLYEVLEGILQPLGIRMVQRKGQVWLYDLNGLYNLADAAEIEWTDTDQMMGTDKVVNDVTVTFSPYAKSELLSGEVVFEDEYSDELTNISTQKPSTFSDLEYYTFFPDEDTDLDYDNLSFTIFLSTQGSGLAGINPTARYFHIQPLLGGSESEGVAWGFMVGGHYSSFIQSESVQKLNAAAQPDGTVLMRTKQVPVQYMDSYGQSKYRLRLSMDMLLDARYNPFEDSSGDNESGNYDRMNSWANFVMVPADLLLKDEEGNVLYHYSNEDVVLEKDLPASINYQTRGKWVSGEPAEPKCWLVWYDTDDRKMKSGALGWKTNRHAIGITTEKLKDSFKDTDAGQYIPYPTTGGYLEVVVYSGVKIYDEGDNLPDMTQANKSDLWERIRWMLYKAPKLEVVKSNIVYGSAEGEDVEYRGTLNEAAKEDLDIESICGTMESPIPTALGVYLRTSDKEMVKKLTRAGRTTQAEQLLIGTLYSQYADRKTRLSGTARLQPGVLGCYTEACQPDKRFICLEDVQNVIADESRMEIVELRPDEYEEK